MGFFSDDSSEKLQNSVNNIVNLQAEQQRSHQGFKDDLLEYLNDISKAIGSIELFFIIIVILLIVVIVAEIFKNLKNSLKANIQELKNRTIMRT